MTDNKVNLYTETKNEYSLKHTYNISDEFIVDLVKSNKDSGEAEPGSTFNKHAAI